MRSLTFGVIIIVVFGAILFLRNRNEFPLPNGEPVSVTHDTMAPNDSVENISGQSMRNNKQTNGVKHSIPLGEILSGGPGKDGIPSIDNPKFISTKEADEFLNSTSPGLGLVIGNDIRFYPYQILVWHEIVNDTVGGEPVLATYCPLCATAIVFKRTVNGDVQEFGVSGKLWKSNLLMYNRTENISDESLWSQVLGEAVLGPETGDRLEIIPSDTVRYGEWKKLHSDTKVLSRDTGADRSYGRDPYGNYYTDDTVSFGATFNDDRLHPKAFVFGIESDGKFKAYHRDALEVGETIDTFTGKTITITKNSADEVRFSADGVPIPVVGGFWFSWLAVHPETELYK